VLGSFLFHLVVLLSSSDVVVRRVHCKMVEDPSILCCILVDVRERWLIEP